MTNRLLVAGFWIGLAFFGVHAVTAQTSPNASHAAVIESQARAVLAQDSIRFELPLAARAVAGERAIAWLLSSKNKPSGETAVALRAGATVVNIDLPRPKDEHGKFVDELGWYRIAYRLEISGEAVTHSILAVGAIATNLMELRLAKPVSLVAGRPIQLRVYACNPVTRNPFSGVQLKATLELESNSSGDEKTSKRTTVREATTDGSGEALITFLKKDAVIESVSVTVHGSLKSPDGGYAEASVHSDLAEDDRANLHIDTDKPLHKPGETVHLRALVSVYGQAAANKALSLAIEDPDSKTILEVPLTTNRFGIAAYDWKTSPQLATGDYFVRFKGDNSGDANLASITIPIRRYDLPEFTVSAAMDRGYYLEGQTPVAHIHAGYLFGKPLAGGSVRVTHSDDQRWNPKTRQYESTDAPEQTAMLDSNGDAEVRLDVKKNYDEFKANEDTYAYGRFQDLEFRAIVTDPSTGRSEPLKFKVRLSHDPVHTYLRQLDGDKSEGDFVITTSHAEGGPVSCKVSLDWLDEKGHPTHAASAVTNRYGLAKVHLRYPSYLEGRTDLEGATYHEFKIRLSARDAEGRISRFDDSEYTRGDPIWFSVAHTLLKPSQPIEAQVHAPQGITLDIEAYSRDGLLHHQQIHMAHATEPVEIPASAAFHGKITLTACQMSRELAAFSKWEPCSFKSVLYPEDRALKIRLTGLQRSYSPGSEVSAGLNLQGAAGEVGISVFDKAVEQRAATEEDENDRWPSSMWWQDDENVSGVTVEDLNRIDTSKPIPEELDLVAETLIGGNAAQQITILNNYEDNDSARDVYESAMQESLKPVGGAVLAARPERLPATLEAVQSIARAAKLDDALLLDPWGTPYKASTGISGDEEVVSLQSAGPDKRFGSDDDFTFGLARRNYFALPGERLTQLAKDAVKAGRPLPKNEEELKAFARAGGLDLGATLDPQGKPYHYRVQVQKRSYTIHVFPHDAVMQQDGGYECCGAWSSPSLDYFLQAEARLSAALRSLDEAGKPFPETEAEAKRAFAAAGIDFDSLRDPLGQPFKLRTLNLMAYTHVESIKAGAGVAEKTKLVTHQMHAIQILRPLDQQAGSPNADIIAQFIQPFTAQSGSDLKQHSVDEGTFNAKFGAIQGIVTDQTGAVVAGAKISVFNTATGQSASGMSLANGSYLISDLLPGLYTVKIIAKGFEGYELSEVSVAWGTLTTVEVTLTIGSSTQTVTVSADAIQVQTESASVASVAKPAGTKGQAKSSSPTFTPRLRRVFEETAYWAPSLETDAGGHTRLHFRLPDSLTTWKLHALASTADGRVAALDRTFKTFQPFFVDLDAPQVLTVGDEITLPANLRNYTAHSLSLPVTVKPADWFTLFTPSVVNATVPSNGTTPAVFGFHATRAVEAGTLDITASNGHEGDAVEKTVRVHPDGEPRSVTASGLLREGSTTLTLDLPADAIRGSIHAELLLYPNLGAHILHSMKAVLERPYGCGEQTISSTYPSLLFFELLKAANGSSPLEATAQSYLQQGYDRLLGYFAAGGGLTYWGRGGETPDPALTAYGIEFLTEAEPYIKVDRSHIVDAIGWLVANQQADGSWNPHYGQTSADLDLYVAEVLSRTMASNAFAGNDSKDLRERVNKSVARAIGWAATSAAAVHDPYASALRLRLQLRLASDSAAVASLRAELAQTAQRDRQGVHWSSPGYSPFYGWGSAGELETSALVLGALRQGEPSSADQALVNDALLYLLRSQDRYGIWYSGQATVRVLQALLPIAIEQMKTPGKTQEFQLTVNGTSLTGADAEALRADPKLLDAPRSLDLTAWLKPGHNELVFSSTSTVVLASAETSASYYVPWLPVTTPTQTKTQTGKEYGLDFGYNCAAGKAKVSQPIECTVDVRRFGSAGYGMLLAEVGLPPGADVDRASLAKLLDDWTISRYELQPDRIVFYLWSWKAEGSHFRFRFTPRYAIRAKAAPATLFDYYNPDLKAILAPQTFSVADSARK
jgi:hypothetical protein